MSTPEGQQGKRYDINFVKELAYKLRRWGKWGPDDEIGSVNFITPAKVIRAASLVRQGKVFSLAIPFDSSGPQKGDLGRVNPIHVMLRDGGDIAAGITLGADDAVYFPLQCATQWDALAHAFEPFEHKMWNGLGTEYVTSFGAQKNSIDKMKDKLVARGILLDVARYKGKQWLGQGEAIYTEDLDGSAQKQGVVIEQGDIVLIRTGQMGQVRTEGEWGDYAGGPAPGLSVTTAEWFVEKEVAAYATDTWGTEVLPNDVSEPRQPLHRILIANAGITMGEIFDLEDLADDCAQDGVYEFMFVAPPIPFTGAVGSPVNPIAIK